jgi:biotin carboxyl carrier protein
MANVLLNEDAWADTEEGTEALLQEWLVKVGDQVQEGQVIGMAELVKTTHEIAAPVAGTVTALNVEAEATFGRTAVLAVIQE